MAETDALWGGYVRDLRIDLTARQVVARVSVTHDGEDSAYRLTLSGVRSVHVERPDAEWERTELTEVHAEDGDGLTRVELIFWTEPNGLVATCESVAVERE